MKASTTNVLIGAAVIAAILYSLYPTAFGYEGFTGGSIDSTPGSTPPTAKNTGDNTIGIIVACVAIFVFILIFVFMRYFRK